MRIAFYIVMLLISLITAVDVTTEKKQTGEKSVAEQMGFCSRQRKTDSVTVFGITVAALVVALISEVVL